jgi:hypothetical protein
VKLKLDVVIAHWEVTLHSYKVSLRMSPSETHTKVLEAKIEVLESCIAKLRRYVLNEKKEND